MNHPQRLHSLDNLRAIMMWLGIVLHVAANHLASESFLPWRDQQRSIMADLTLLFIHAFRIPVFFILAGFFVAMLIIRRGYGGMFKHRLRRIGLPFVIFWPPIFIGTATLILLYVHLMVTGTLGIDPKLLPPDLAQPNINTIHMWFIYYLLWLCLFTALAGVLSKRLSYNLKALFARCWMILGSRWWGFIVLSVPLAVTGSFYKAGIISASGSFVPQPGELVYSGLFFVFGIYLFREQENLLALYSKYCWRYVVAGLLLFIVFLGLIDTVQSVPSKISHSQFWLAFIYGSASWLWSFSLIGLFVRYLGNQNRFLRYISESSYWAYLVHMLGTVGFGVVLYKTPFNAVTKMGINIFATTLFCILTYHIFVRFSPIGTLLSGQRHTLWLTKKFNKIIAAA